MTVKDRPLSYWITLARMGFEEDLARLMGKKDVSRSDLARKVGVSPQFITKILNGTNNYTLATMAKLARGIGAVLEVRLADEGSEVVRVVDPSVAVVLDAMQGLESLTSTRDAEFSGATVVDITGYRIRRESARTTPASSESASETVPYEASHG